MTLSFLSRRRPAPSPRPRPVLVSWTTHYLVENGRTVAREAWVRFPGDTAPRLVPVALEVAA